MATFTVDLPAQTAGLRSTTPLADGVGTHFENPSPEMLSTDDTSAYITFDVRSPGIGIGELYSYADSTGFGLWTPPAGAVFVKAEFVAKMRLPFGGGGDIPDGIYDWSYTHLPVYRWPMVTLYYGGAPYAYNFSQIRTDGQWETYVGIPIEHHLGDADYVIAGIGEPDTGTDGLCPIMRIDNVYPYPNVPVAVDIAYLAIRVTYTRALNPPPCRVYPRDDNLTTGPGRILPTPRSQQASNRIIGGYN